MADRPMMFSAPMIRALLDGRKTQTRRVLRLPPKQYVNPSMGGWEPCTNGGGGCFTFGRNGERIPVAETVGIWHRTTGFCMDAPYQRGDRLWVRETHQFAMSADGPCVLLRGTGSRWSPEWTGPDEGAGPSYDYDRFPGDYSRWAADVESAGRPWRPAIHMPRWASRLTLIVTDVRVQRLQDISEDDARAEGISGNAGGAWGCEGLIEDFSGLWASLHGPTAWDANPWVAAIGFTVQRENIDTIAAAALDIAGAA